MLNDASIYDDNMTLLQAYRNLAKRVKALEEGGGGGGSYTLPTASATVKGGVKIGSGLLMNGEVLSATGGGGGGSSLLWTSGEYETFGIGSEGGPAEGAILGVYDQLLLKKEPSTQTSIEFVNVDDPTDTITLYNTNDTVTDYETDYLGFDNPLIGIPQRYSAPPSPIALIPKGTKKVKITTDQVFPLYKADSGELSDGDIIWANVVESDMTVSFYVRSWGDPVPLFNEADGYITKLEIYITEDPEAEEPVVKHYIAEGDFGFYTFYSQYGIKLRADVMVQS